MTGPAILEPAACDDAFVDALVGLDRLCGWLAPVDAAVGAGTGGADGDRRDAADPDELVDAVLGLVSLRTTLSLVLAALASEPADAAEDPTAGWPEMPRELLR